MSMKVYCMGLDSVLLDYLVIIIIVCSFISSF